MGVRGLIGVLERTCGEKAKRVVRGDGLSELRNQVEKDKGNRSVLAVDAMNLLFHLAGLENGPGVVEGLNVFCTLLREHGVKAVCVFDSNKMSKQRKTLASDRRKQRDEAIEELKKMESQHGAEVPHYVKRKREVLRSRTIHVGPKEVRAAWDQLSKSGVCTVLMAPDEADLVCVEMVQRGTAFACLSNDSDMFVHGCPRVLRQFDPIEGRFELWDTAVIYAGIGVTPERFVEMCEEATKAKYTHKELYEIMVSGVAQTEKKSERGMRMFEGGSGLELTWRRGIKAIS